MASKIVAMSSCTFLKALLRACFKFRTSKFFREKFERYGRITRNPGFEPIRLKPKYHIPNTVLTRQILSKYIFLVNYSSALKTTPAWPNFNFSPNTPLLLAHFICKIIVFLRIYEPLLNDIAYAVWPISEVKFYSNWYNFPTKPSRYLALVIRISICVFLLKFNGFQII